MTIKLDIQMTGLKEFEANLKILRDQFQVRTGGLINRSLMAGARIIRDEAKRLAPLLKTDEKIASVGKRGTASFRKARRGTKWRTRGAIRNAIVAAYGQNRELSVVVRVRTRGYIFERNRFWGNFKKFSNPAIFDNPNYWWLLEFGTSKMAARPFMRPAFESKKLQALDAFTLEMRRQLTVEFKKFRQYYRPALKMAA